MIRIGIVDSENSHAMRFSELANIPEKRKGLDIPDCKVVGIYGFEPEQTKKVAEACNIEYIAEKPEDLLGKIDAAMVVFRHGDNHAKHALPFIEAGIPTFIDKPFAVKLSDCQAMIDAAEKKGVAITSYSTVRYSQDVVEFAKQMENIGEINCGSSTGPCDFKSQYGGPFFYGTHTLETLLALFGYNLQSIYAAENGGDVVATVKYDDGKITTATLMSTSRAYHVAAYGKKGAASKVLDISTCYREGFKVFLEMVQTGKLPLEYDQLLAPIRFMTAIVKSLDEKREVLYSEV